MKCDKYIGLDVHQATTSAAVLDADGNWVMETVVASEAATIIRFLKSLSGVLHVTFEESTPADWLYNVIRAHVEDVTVCDPRRNKLLAEGSKGDKPDARKLAELLRAGLIRPVYHGQQTTRTLKQLVRAYETLSVDTQRTMVRIKAIYRSQGIRTGGRNVYQEKQRQFWLDKLKEPGLAQRVALLFEQLDQLRPLRRRAKQAMLVESQKHRAVKLLKSIPQLGAIRCALIVAAVDNPHRFRTKRQLWSYCGLAVVTHMSAEYEIQGDRVLRSRKPIATRGLNPNGNRRMKEVFISAAVGGCHRQPYRSYVERLQKGGTRPEMARLSLARKISAIALTIWKKGEKFDPEKLNRATSSVSS